LQRAKRLLIKPAAKMPHNLDVWSGTASPQILNILGPGVEPGAKESGFQVRAIWEPESEEIYSPSGDMQPLYAWGEISYWLKEQGEKFWLERQGFSLFLDLEKRLGEARLSHPRAWQNIFRISYFFLLLERRGLLLHASGLGRQGKAFLFPGVSGAGKTTVVRNSAGLPVLSDDMVAVQLKEVDHGVVAHGTPFYGDWDRPGEEISLPLKGFYFPCHSQENLVIPLTPGEVIKRLLPCVCTFTTNVRRSSRLFDQVVQLAERVPGFELQFRPGPDFWKVIDAS
jgi:hypothetical protein